MNKISGSILAFDVGSRRIGVAKAMVPPRIAYPLTTLIQDETLETQLQALVARERPVALVIGRPRNQEGTVTLQTKVVEEWVERHITRLGLSTFWQDESLTSKAAETHLEAGRKQFKKDEIDALAATVILTDFLETDVVVERLAA